DPKAMGKVTDEVIAWTDAQNAHTRSVLDGLPGRNLIEDKFRPLMQIGSVSAPTMAGDYYFYSKREGTQNQPRIMMRKRLPSGAVTEPRVILDPAVIDPSGLTALGGLLPSQDGKLLAFGLYRRGDENTTIYIMDVETGRWLPDTLEGKASPVQWLPDNSGLFYERLADVNDPYSSRIMFHTLGRHPRFNPVLFKQYTKEENEKLATTWGPGAGVSRDGKWMILVYWTSTSSNDIWAIDLRKWWKDGVPGGGTFEMVPIKTGSPHKYFGSVEGDTFYMLTDDGAPKNRVVAIDLNGNIGDPSTWKTIIPENKDAVLTSFSIADGIIAADYEEKASSRIRLFAMDGTPRGDLRLPGIGSAGLSVEHDRTEAYLSFTSFNYPSTIFKVDLAKADAEPAVWERPDVPVDPTIVEVKQVTYSSKDGTPVTMFIVHRKGLTLDGTNPTILNGYGGFNISETPFFSPTLFPWFEAGGVFAMPNLRGGGEYGKAWHEGGMLGNKQNTFDDMIAAAEWLVANKYTNPNRLGAIGGSNGGLLMGALMTQRPELFRAIVCQVPLLDMLRYEQFLMARYWVPEYGDPANPEHFRWLQAYSPYHNIKQGTKYPAVMFTAGENDTRVHALHARKMAAAMQAATASDPAERPILLWVDRDAGHGAGKPLNLRIRDAVDTRMFFMWQLGMLGGDTPASPRNY
ncbi:MAG: prolyl oligopeptidase family serine peptidase, partial [Phycisphaerales bacterium]|nr:prolyl oligopeptidase family serine peptidase [Phycisphaerales bacterium]